MADNQNIVLKIKSDEEEQAVKEEAKKIGAPYIDARYINVPVDILMQFGLERSNNFSVVPIEYDGTTLKIGFSKFDNVQKSVGALEDELGYTIKPYLISPQAFRALYSQFNKIPKAPEGKKRITDDNRIELPSLNIAHYDDILPYIRQKDPELMISNMISAAVHVRASDIHLEPKQTATVVSFRIDGVMHDVGEISKKEYEQLLTRLKFYGHMKLNVQVPQDGNLQTKMGKKEIDVRIGTIPTVSGEAVALRILKTEAKLLSLDELGLIESDSATLKKHIARPKGMILVTGPTGSGKTTTLYAILNLLNKPEVNIITLEDPVEYLLPDVIQSQINVKAGYDFAHALRAVLRHDPDIIMIGEIRDAETAETAFRAALTGHIALSTYHAGEAAGVVPAMVEMGVKAYLAVSAMNMIIAQRLVRKLCQTCKKPSEYSDQIMQEVNKKLERLYEVTGVKKLPLKLYTSAGCDKCQGVGYKGQIGVFEILEISPTIAKIASSTASIDEIKQAALAAGMKTIEQDGYYKAIQGQTTLEEVWRVVGSE